MIFPAIKGHEWVIRIGPIPHVRLYLAGPYSSGGGPRNHAVMCHRANEHARCAGMLMLKGHYVFSPVAMHHAIKAVCELPTDWETFWRDRDYDFIQTYADALAIFNIPGWHESEGTLSELVFAVAIGKPVFVVNQDGEAIYELRKTE